MFVKEKHLFVIDKGSLVGVQGGMEKAHNWKTSHLRVRGLQGGIRRIKEMLICLLWKF